MKKLVSVVIPLYNHEKYIGPAIESVINQTYSNVELIIVDDGSKDGSYDEALRYKNKYPGIISLIKQENSGAHNAINRGIQESSGEYISILNSDDLFRNDKISRCLELSKNKNVDVIFGGVEFIDGDGNIIKSGGIVDWQARGKDFLDKSGLFFLSILNENIISTTSNMFFSKKIFTDGFRFQPLRYCHDLDFILFCAKKYEYYFDKNNTHISYRYHESNTLKENLLNINLEIAAVIASSLISLRMDLIKNNELNVVYLNSFLDNKNISKAIIYLMMFYVESLDRDKLYAYIYEIENKKKLYSLLK